MLTKIFQLCSRYLAVLSAIMTIVIMGLIVVNVISRRLGRGSIPGLLELSEVGLVFLVFCGIAYGLQTRTHVAVTLATSRMSAKMGRIAVAVGLVILIVVLAWALWATADMAIKSTIRGEARFGITHVPIWPARIMIPVGLFFTLGEAVIQLIAVIRGEEKIRGEMPDADKEIAV